MDSNHDKSLQRALCYRYTTGQATRKLSGNTPSANRKFSIGMRLSERGGLMKSEGKTAASAIKRNGAAIKSLPSARIAMYALAGSGFMAGRRGAGGRAAPLGRVWP